LVAKASIDCTQINGILLESSLLKLIENEEFICKVQEEIIEFVPETNEVKSYMAIIEMANNDLSKIIKIWKSAESQNSQEKFSEHKLAYFCLKTMEAMCYMHSKNIYYGDMKPENVLIFRNMTLKIGDFGISLKLPDDVQDDDTFFINGYTSYYSMDIIKTFVEQDMDISYAYLM
jgi:serine/threonine protein kinase